MASPCKRQQLQQAEGTENQPPPDAPDTAQDSLATLEGEPEQPELSAQFGSPCEVQEAGQSDLAARSPSTAAAPAAMLATIDPVLALQQQLDECLPLRCPKAIVMQFALEQLLVAGASELDRTQVLPGFRT